MGIVIDDSLEPIEIRDGESIFIDLSMALVDGVAPDIPTDWTSSFSLTKFEDENAEVASGVVEKDGTSKIFEVRVPYTDTASQFGKFVISVRVIDDITKFSQYIYTNVVEIS